MYIIEAFRLCTVMIEYIDLIKCGSLYICTLLLKELETFGHGCAGALNIQGTSFFVLLLLPVTTVW